MRKSFLCFPSSDKVTNFWKEDKEVYTLYMNLKSYSNITTPFSLSMHNTGKLSYPEGYIFTSAFYQSIYLTCSICQKKYNKIKIWVKRVATTFFSLSWSWDKSTRMHLDKYKKSCEWTVYLGVFKNVISLRFFVTCVIISGIFWLRFCEYDYSICYLP